MSISPVPVLAHLGAWGRQFLPASRELCIRAQLLEDGGLQMGQEFMDELRAQHLGKRASFKGHSVAQQLQTAYEFALAEKSKSGSVV